VSADVVGEQKAKELQRPAEYADLVEGIGVWSRFPSRSIRRAHQSRVHRTVIAGSGRPGRDPADAQRKWRKKHDALERFGGGEGLFGE